MAEAAEKVRIAPRGVGKYLAQIAIVFAVQLAAGKLGDALAVINSGGIGPVWPASGIALAALLLFGYQVWPGVAARCLRFSESDSSHCCYRLRGWNHTRSTDRRVPTPSRC